MRGRFRSNGAVAEMLQLRMARESKLAEISRIHNEILGVTVPLIDDVYFELIMQSEAIAQTGGSGVADLFDSGLNAVMAVLRSEAQVNLLEGILRDAAHASDPSRLQPLRERFIAAKSALLEKDRKSPRLNPSHSCATRMTSSAWKKNE